jgi:hypothetical protein
LATAIAISGRFGCFLRAGRVVLKDGDKRPVSHSGSANGQDQYGTP